MTTLFVLFQRLHQLAVDARRRASTTRYLAWASAAGLTMGLSLAFLVLAVASLWTLGLWVLALSLLAVSVVPALAPTLLRHVLVPLGWWRAARLAGLVSVSAGTDPRAFGLAAAAWAVLAARRPPSGEAELGVLRERDRRGALGDAEVVATAFLLARTDARAARELLGSVPELVEQHPAVRELAGEYLAVDAIERGAYAELLPDESARWPASPLRFLLEGVAARRLGHSSAPSAWGLFARWVLAPYRRQTWALWRAPLGEASAHDEPRPTAPPEATAPAAGAPLGEAVRLHVAAVPPAAVAEGAPPAAAAERAAELVGLLAAWDAALSAPALRTWLERRALELDAPLGAVERTLEQLVGQVVDELVAHVERHHLPVPPLPSSRFGQALAAQLRHGRLAAVELAFDRWSERVASGQKLPPADEWREFLTVRRSYRELVGSGGEEVRRLVFPRAFDAANRAAVVLWNQRDEHVLAHAILRWQLAEALAVGDSAAIELAGKNCRLKVQTRTGEVNP